MTDDWGMAMSWFGRRRQTATDGGDIWRICESDGIRHLFITSGGWSDSYLRLFDSEGLEGLAVRLGPGESSSFLDRLPGLRRVSLVADDVAQIEPVTRQVEAEDVRLELRSWRNAALDFSALGKVRSLNVNGRVVFDSLISRPTLEELSIVGMLGADLSELPGLPRLRTLQLYPGRRLLSTAGVERFEQLEELGLYHQTGLSDLEGISSLQSLESLAIDTCRKLTSLDRVRGIASLKRLSIDNSGDIETLEPIRDLLKLGRFFAVESTNIVDADLSPLQSLPNLNTVGMRSRPAYRPSLEDVKAGLDAQNSDT